jgi:hypothetical protein
MATLEFAMGLPFLMLIGAAVFYTGIASLNKTKAALRARHEVWKMRDTTATHNLVSAERTANQALYLFSPNTAGQFSGQAHESFEIYDWLGSLRTGKSGAAVLTGTWDHRQLADFTQDPDGPHIGTALDILGLPPIFGEAVNALAALLTLNIDSLPNSDDINEAEEGLDQAREEAERRRQEIIDTINRLRQELAVLQQERAQIVQDLQAAQEELDRLRDIDPRTPEVEAQIAAQEDRIQGLEDQLEAKDQQIEAKEREIEQWEEALERANEETEDLPDAG